MGDEAVSHENRGLYERELYLISQGGDLTDNAYDWIESVKSNVDLLLNV